MSGTRHNIAFVGLFVVVLSAGCENSADISTGLQAELGSERIAACISAGQQRDESVLPLLVDRLEDSDADVRLFAIGALKKITGKDLGYRYYASSSERSEVVRKWRKWLTDRRKEKNGG